MNRDSVGAGERVRQYFELLAVNSNLLRCAIAEVLDLRTHFVDGETALAGGHLILVSGREREDSLSNVAIQHPSLGPLP